MSDLHTILVQGEWFRDINAGKMLFLINRNMKSYKVGDILRLKEGDGISSIMSSNYSGSHIDVDIIAIYRNMPGLETGYMIISIRRRVNVSIEDTRRARRGALELGKECAIAAA